MVAVERVVDQRQRPAALVDPAPGACGRGVAVDQAVAEGQASPAGAVEAAGGAGDVADHPRSGDRHRAAGLVDAATLAVVISPVLRQAEVQTGEAARGQIESPAADRRRPGDHEALGDDVATGHIKAAAIGVRHRAGDGDVLQDGTAALDVDAPASGGRAILEDEVRQGRSRAGLDVDRAADTAGGAVLDGEASDQRMVAGGHLDAQPSSSLSGVNHRRRRIDPPGGQAELSAGERVAPQHTDVVLNSDVALVVDPLGDVHGVAPRSLIDGVGEGAARGRLVNAVVPGVAAGDGDEAIADGGIGDDRVGDLVGDTDGVAGGGPDGGHVLQVGGSGVRYLGPQDDRRRRAGRQRDLPSGGQQLAPSQRRSSREGEGVGPVAVVDQGVGVGDDLAGIGVFQDVGGQRHARPDDDVLDHVEDVALKRRGGRDRGTVVDGGDRLRRRDGDGKGLRGAGGEDDRGGDARKRGGPPAAVGRCDEDGVAAGPGVSIVGEGVGEDEGLAFDVAGLLDEHGAVKSGAQVQVGARQALIGADVGVGAPGALVSLEVGD